MHRVQRVARRGNAILAVVIGDAAANMPVYIPIAHEKGRTACNAGAVVPCLDLPRNRPRNAVIARLSEKSVHMPDEITSRCLGLSADLPARAHTVIAGACLRLEAPLGNRARDPLVDDVDNATNRLAAIAKRCWATNDLHPVGSIRRNRHTMILAHRRHIPHTDTILLNAHPIIVETANDRAARPRCKGALRYTRLILEQRAERCGRRGENVLAYEHRHRGGKLIKRRGKWRRGDDKRRDQKLRTDLIFLGEGRRGDQPDQRANRDRDRELTPVSFHLAVVSIDPLSHRRPRLICYNITLPDKE